MEYTSPRKLESGKMSKNQNHPAEEEKAKMESESKEQKAAETAKSAPKPELSAEELRLLATRKRQKGKKPEFRGPDSHKKKRVNPAWRRPTGIHHKVRSGIKAKGPMPTTGFGSPRAVRGLHPSGFEEVLIHRLEELSDVDKKKQAIRISGKAGMKKRAAIEEKALELGLKILNPAPVEGKEE